MKLIMKTIYKTLPDQVLDSTNQPIPYDLLKNAVSYNTTTHTITKMSDVQRIEYNYNITIRWEEIETRGFIKKHDVKIVYNLFLVLSHSFGDVSTYRSDVKEEIERIQNICEGLQHIIFLKKVTKQNMSDMIAEHTSIAQLEHQLKNEYIKLNNIDPLRQDVLAHLIAIEQDRNQVK